MPKIQRQTQKIFAGNAPADDIAAFGSFKTGTPVYTDNIETLQSTAYEGGWSAGTVADEAPFMEELNGVQYGFSKQLAYLFQEGIPEYDENTTYYKGSIVKAVNEDNTITLAYSLTDENIGNPITDENNWAVSNLNGGGGTGAGLNMFDTVLKDHILTFEESKGYALQGTYVYKTPVAGSRYGYPDFYNECVTQKTAGTATQTTLGETTITTYNNANGHIFYNIADKAVVDAFYNVYGACWMYGVDTENERIFLPRNDWFTQNGSTTDVGKFVAAGLPNITGTFNNEVNMVRSSTGAFSLKNRAAYYATGQAKYNDLYQTVEINASDSSTIYGNSDTVQPAAVKKIMYMVVGSTEVTSSIIDVEEVTTSENDTIPLFTAQYFNFTPNNPSWLKAGTQKNSGGIYTTAYNTLVACLTDNTYNIKVVDTANMTAGVDYSEYWKVDQTAMTFTTPTKIGNEGIFGNVPVVGNGMALGLTDGTNNAGAYYSLSNHDIGAEQKLYGTTVGSTITSFDQFLANNKALSVTTDPEKSGLITDTSGVEIPEDWGLYFKVANAVQNLELLDAGEVLEAVADKVDMTNTQWATNACIPDYSAGVTQYVDTEYTATIDGFIFVFVYGNGGGHLSINGIDFNIQNGNSGGVYVGASCFMPIGKNDVYKFTWDGGSEYRMFFFPMKGAN